MDDEAGKQPQAEGASGDPADAGRTWQITDAKAPSLGPTPFPSVDSDHVDVQRVAAPPLVQRRWLFAAIAIAVVLVVGSAGAWVLSNTLSVVTAGAGAAAPGYAYIPDSVSLAAEIRIDLPAGQKEQLGTFLSRFPDFGEASSVESKLVDWADDAVKQHSQNRADYQNDVQSFFTGWAVVALTATAAQQTGMDALMPSYLAVVGSNDQLAAQRAMLKLRTAGLTWTSEDVGDFTVWSGIQSAGREDGVFRPAGQAYAVTDDAVLVAGTAADVKQAINTRTTKGSSLLDQTEFSTLLQRVPAGRLGLMWTNAKVGSMFDPMGGGLMGGALMTGGMMPPCGAAASARQSSISALYLRDGRAVVDVISILPDKAPNPDIHPSTLDTHIPADTIFYGEAHGTAASLRRFVDCMRKQSMYGDGFTELEKSIGKIDDLLGWLGDSAVAVRYDGQKVTGGLVIRTSDANKASETLGELRAALTAMGGRDGGVTVAVHEETYADARLVVFDFSGMSTTSLPSIAPTTSLAYAVKDDLVVIGVDASFAKAVLDTQAANSLATKPSYARALDFTSGQSNSGLFYVDTPAAVALLDDYYQSVPTGADSYRNARKYLVSLDDSGVVFLADDKTQTMRLELNSRPKP